MEFILVIFAYLIGSIPAGLVIGKFFYKKDIRNFGSGNLGATNSFRILGKRAGTIVMAFDMGKGTVAVLVSKLLGFDMGLVVLCALLAIVGHSFPIFAGFKGGKSVATSAGTLLGIAPLLFISTVTAFLITLKVSKYVSLSSVVAGWFVTCVAVIWYLFYDGSSTLTIIVFCAVSFVTFKHRTNFKRIKAGTEPKIKFM